jgi:hypothetical protein
VAVRAFGLALLGLAVPVVVVKVAAVLVVRLSQQNYRGTLAVQAPGKAAAVVVVLVLLVHLTAVRALAVTVGLVTHLQ